MAGPGSIPDTAYGPNPCGMIHEHRARCKPSAPLGMGKKKKKDFVHLERNYFLDGVFPSMSMVYISILGLLIAFCSFLHRDFVHVL